MTNESGMPPSYDKGNFAFTAGSLSLEAPIMSSFCTCARESLDISFYCCMDLSEGCSARGNASVHGMDQGHSRYTVKGNGRGLPLFPRNHVTMKSHAVQADLPRVSLSAPPRIDFTSTSLTC